MKLYYSPGSCSLAAHIALREAGMKFALEKVALPERRLVDGGDYAAIAPKGYVPLLELDDGERLTECPAILQYVADHAPGSGLAPGLHTFAHYRLVEWLNFVATEVHKGFSPLFNRDLDDDARAWFTQRVQGRLAWLDGQLASRTWLMGEDFSVADAYLFVVTNWAPRVGVDLAGLAGLADLRARVAARPAVQAALAAEATPG